MIRRQRFGAIVLTADSVPGAMVASRVAHVASNPIRLRQFLVSKERALRAVLALHRRSETPPYSPMGRACVEVPGGHAATPDLEHEAERRLRGRDAGRRQRHGGRAGLAGAGLSGIPSTPLKPRGRTSCVNSFDIRRKYRSRFNVGPRLATWVIALRMSASVVLRSHRTRLSSRSFRIHDACRG